ncbi:helix-turn-helix domain-containing protein [Streptococcus timonensis]|uniref:helix-turn-helix domain-containing protein n=1 Tax=Streptococcus timonensis TaxID=1852387 RepID=UPI00094E9A05|nr:helix-turn-helix transcriptional regulator [Streptococcus timonensis]
MDYKKRLTEKQRERFAFMLRQKRLEIGLTISEFAYKLGYSESSISCWERKIKNPNLYKVQDVASFFGVPLNVLIGEE